jgi:heme/copper-type cytochrome/quinol oxidase subunit 3
MKNRVLLFLFLSFSFSILASIPYRTQDTIPVIKDKNIETIKEQEDTNTSTITELAAERALIRAEEQVKKARNAFIFSILTFGLFYVLAIYWEASALYNATIARRFYRKSSKNRTQKEAANKVFYKAIGLLFAHIISLFLLLLFINADIILAIPEIFSSPKGLGFLGISLAAVADYFFFHIFFEDKKAKKK